MISPHGWLVVGAATDVVVPRAIWSCVALLLREVTVGPAVGFVVVVVRDTAAVLVGAPAATVVGGAAVTVVEVAELVVVETGTRTAGTSSVAGAGSGRTAR